MPKKKKTRKEKVLADTRHKEYLLEPLEQVQTETRNNVQLESNSDVVKKVEHSRHIQSSSKTQVITTANYSYLYSDLLKTLMLTISVIVAEIVLRYFVFGA